ncbi:hypothetical protein DSO57_1009732 [Entomophthora muscae]|uniref:Uncharacterized protein n=1 Tax=Entomophthora muscae TaxID=34485 RepID=A0ACC2USH4_9FUNG|nr:hypothetical protein DSO57_1009732 [Entomophthora muscae]
MWYPPEVCSSGAVGFAGCCLEHFCGLAYQSKVSLPACYYYMEDVLLNCLTIGSAFSACGRWGRLVIKGNLCLPLFGWTGMSRNSQLAWCQMLVALAFFCNQISSGSTLNIETPLFHSKLSFHPTSSCKQRSFYRRGILYKLPQELCMYTVDHLSILNLLNSIGVCGHPGNDFEWAYP